MIMAPIGVAAHLVGGTTVHHSFALDHDLQSMMDRASKAEAQIQNTELIVIDECTMLTADMLYKIQEICYEVRKRRSRSKRFGGKHVLLFGDPAQLPAIGRTMFTAPLWTRHFKVLELIDIVRQTDLSFIQMLNELCLGKVPKYVLDIFQSCSASLDTVDCKTTTIVVSTTAKRDELNKRFVQKLSSPSNPLFTYTSVDKDATNKPLNKCLLQIMRSKEYAKATLPQHL